MNAADRAGRERKQKIFVGIGGVVLLLLLAIQLPKILGGSSESAAPSTKETVAVDPGTNLAPSKQVPVSLADTDRPPAAGPDKLRWLPRFSPKDPFVQQAKTPAPAAGTSKTEGTKASGPGQQGTPTPTTGFTVGPVAASVTLISVNGTRQALLPGAAFPTVNPVFVLMAEQPKTKSVTIGVAGGEYASGAKAIKLKIGRALVLENTTTGARYKLVLVAVGDGSAAAGAASKAAPSDDAKP